MEKGQLITETIAEDIIGNLGGVVTKDSTVVNENANKDSRVYNTRRDLTAGAVAKAIGLNMLPKEVAAAHRKGELHFHDLDYSPYSEQTNCCLVDLETMFENGFEIGNAYVGPPKSIQTAAAQTAQALANIASMQYGGTTFNRIDEVFAPYAEMNYQKHLNKAKKWVAEEKQEDYAKENTVKDIQDAMQSLEYEINTLFSSQGQTPFTTLGFGLGTSWIEREIQKAILNTRLEGLGKDKRTAIFPKLVFTLKDGVNLKETDPNYDIKQLALECATKRMYPDVVMYDKIVELTGSFKAPMGCVDGKEFIVWEDKQKHYGGIERLWEHAADKFGIKKQANGQDEYIDVEGITIEDSHTGETKLTPVKRVIKNYNQDWLRLRLSTGRTLECTTDHPLPVKGKGRVRAKDLEIGDELMKVPTKEQSREGTLVKEFCKVNAIEVLDCNKPSYDVTTKSDYFDVSGIVSHNCRSFLQGWVDENGKEVNEGRNNLGVVTLNLVRIALENPSSTEDYMDALKERLKLAKQALVYRVNRVKEASPENAPLFYQQGVLGHFLKDTDSVDEVFKNKRATVSLGYIGLYEVGTVYFGPNWESLPEAKEFTLSILKEMKKHTDAWGDEYGYHFSVYGTPSESLTDRFCQLDKEEFGVIEDVTDKGYYTNSFHYDVRKEITPFEKIDFEKDYPKYSSGGFIHYCEYPNLRQNPKALETVWDYAYDKIGYLGTNTPIDHCYECGFDGDFDPTERGFKCPECGNTDPETCDVVKRTCGYLGNPQLRPMVEGRHKEISARVKHMPNGGV